VMSAAKPCASGEATERYLPLIEAFVGVTLALA